MSDSVWQLEVLPPLSLYIHIPWCIKKCPYCDFNSHNRPSVALPEDAYVDALISDLTQSLPLIWGRCIGSIFIGGGTPSLFSGRAINRILGAVRSLTNLSPFAEITLEANPGATDACFIEEYAQSGVNRVSFGVQSFNDLYLSALGRVHDGKTAQTTIQLAQRAFNNINLDLIYGLPNQTIEDLKSDLDIALNFNVSHLSVYNLTIEPNTAFHKSPPSGLPDNDLCYVMQDEIVHRLKQSGYTRYEVSAFAVAENTRCWHNLNYWQFGDYLGIGAGAHSKLSMADKIIRQVRHKHPQNYMDTLLNSKFSLTKAHIVEDIEVTAEELPFEFLLNGFRLIEGFDTRIFVERTGLSLNAILPKLLQGQQLGFLDMVGTRVRPTVKGVDFLNELLMLFLA